MLAEDNPSSDNRERNKAKSKTNVCHFFNTKAGCRFGDKCRFKHEALNQDPVGASKEAFYDIDYKSVGINQNEELSYPKRPDSSFVKQEEGDVKVRNPRQFEDPEEVIEQPVEKINSQVCSHFVKKGWCRFGKRCKFSHPKRERKVYSQKPRRDRDGKLAHLDSYTGDHGDDDHHDDEDTERGERFPLQQPDNRKQFCRFYLKRRCRHGDACKFQHDKSSSGATEETASSKQQSSVPDLRNKNNSNLAKKRSDLTADEILSLKKTECQQLKKRFPKGKLEVLEESQEDCRYKVEFLPTDPDWPYDIKVFCLEIGIPANYPLSIFTLELPDDDTLPSSVRGYIERRVTEWLDDKQAKLVEADKVELVFRPFLRWFDRNLEDMVTEGLRRYQRELAAKAAGFEFIPAKPVSERKLDKEEEEEEVEEGEPTESENTQAYEEDRDSEDTDSEDTDSEASSEECEGSKAKTSYADVERKGTEILLRNLQLRENAATLVFQKLAIVIQCGRCKSTTEFTTPAGRLNSIHCPKCYNEQRLVFRPAMAHHFSAVIGYLDLADCQPYDLILQDCLGAVSCLNCSKEMKLDGLVPGQVKQSWCQRCHKKLTIAGESVRFQQLQPSDLTDQCKVHQIQLNKPRKVMRDPAIQEGKPLPADGTCKHYKKSFRWLRFPCCGKCYPCDICHDDKEGDHEMKFASRMICGFCCKEQPYTAEKPCVSCGSQLTKVRSMHWEGGRGCRDKIRMSKNDVHKYSSMSKTISKKAQEKQETKKSGKKTTKLRHT